MSPWAYSFTDLLSALVIFVEKRWDTKVMGRNKKLEPPFYIFYLFIEFNSNKKTHNPKNYKENKGNRNMTEVLVKCI